MRTECPSPRPADLYGCDNRADDVGGPGVRGLRLSPDQRPWWLPLAIRLDLSVGAGKAPGCVAPDGSVSRSEPGRGVWTRALQIERRDSLVFQSRLAHNVNHDTDHRGTRLGLDARRWLL
jgi:hypothetical protein